MDVISRYWLSTVVSAEESSTQVEVAFTRALLADGKDHLLEASFERITHEPPPVVGYYTPDLVHFVRHRSVPRSCSVLVVTHGD
jgi:hypothetical protein